MNVWLRFFFFCQSNHSSDRFKSTSNLSFFIWGFEPQVEPNRKARTWIGVLAKFVSVTTSGSGTTFLCFRTEVQVFVTLSTVHLIWLVLVSRFNFAIRFTLHTYSMSFRHLLHGPRLPILDIAWSVGRHVWHWCVVYSAGNLLLPFEWMQRNVMDTVSAVALSPGGIVLCPVPCSHIFPLILLNTWKTSAISLSHRPHYSLKLGLLLSPICCCISCFLFPGSNDSLLHLPVIGHSKYIFTLGTNQTVAQTLIRSIWARFDFLPFLEISQETGQFENPRYEMLELKGPWLRSYVTVTPRSVKTMEKNHHGDRIHQPSTFQHPHYHMPLNRFIFLTSQHKMMLCTD